MTWLDRAEAFIAEIDRGISATAPLSERKRALQSQASRFHGGTSWGRKVWSRAKRQYLAKYGPKSDTEVPRRHLSPMERMMLATKGHEAKIRMGL